MHVPVFVFFAVFRFRGILDVKRDTSDVKRLFSRHSGNGVDFLQVNSHLKTRVDPLILVEKV